VNRTTSEVREEIEQQTLQDLRAILDIIDQRLYELRDEQPHFMQSLAMMHLCVLRKVITIAYRRRI
jgi:ferritin-like protein